MSEHPWILATEPSPDARNVPSEMHISIHFKEDMSRHTLNARNILILDGMDGGRLISNRFAYRYHAEKNMLQIYFKDRGDGFACGNDIEVILTGRIANASNVTMDIPYSFHFSTASRLRID
ncbi:Ig-like domain-containing protein [Cohnella faecalis]|uniref:SbsA Ig-like domain-containing protein n=1 Tax=Cohnella faecalis TaxID=2315694 RepID=A0A398CMR3_9BACL|nr:Ig-like domain-containing protein [Cohnella faecalis]RIE03755.1 hypothetical protein D3H35_09360 [Cohnella faecalis]